jgi:pseudoazurin
MLRALFLVKTVAILTALGAMSVRAETVEVEMLNMAEGQMMVYEPAVVHIEPGDTVHFVATSKGHNAQAIPGMIPEGGEDFQVPYNVDKEVTFEAEGVFGYKCLPHYALGMVGLVVVGDPDANLSEARAQAQQAPGKADDRFADYFAQVAGGG